MRVLVACEFSGVVRDAFANRGHDAWSCDLLPTERRQRLMGLFGVCRVVRFCIGPRPRQDTLLTEGETRFCFVMRRFFHNATLATAVVTGTSQSTFRGLLINSVGKSLTR